jgi:hypothetical protein
MKKLIMILMAAAVMSCGDGRNSARENEADEMDNTELAEPDSTLTETDTTSTGDLDPRQDDGDMDRGETPESEIKTENDTL